MNYYLIIITEKHFSKQKYDPKTKMRNGCHVKSKTISKSRGKTSIHMTLSMHRTVRCKKKKIRNCNGHCNTSGAFPNRLWQRTKALDCLVINRVMTRGSAQFCPGVVNQIFRLLN